MPRFTTRPEVSGTFGMVAATHWLAAQSGMSMLEAGGNAFDAAAAAGFVLQVVEPHQNGLGGEAPMVAYSVVEDDVVVVNGQGPAPAGATISAFRDRGLDLVPGDGLLAACVPAAFGSWMLLLERFGSLKLRQVMSPAIGYATDGFPALPLLAGVLRALERRFRTEWPSSAELWLAGGVPSPDQRITNRPLAETYRRILNEAEAAGPDRLTQIEAARAAFYEGFVARAVGEFAAAPNDFAGGTSLTSAHIDPGLVTAYDLARWRASIERPVRLDYGQFELAKPAFGQAPVLLQQLALLDGIDLAGLGESSPDLIHVMTEAAKLAFADREAFYGDPIHIDVPMADLLSPEYNAERRRLIGVDANAELRPGRPGGRNPYLPQLALEAAARHLGLDAHAERSGPAHSLGDPTRRGAPGEGAETGQPSDASRGPSDHDTCHIDVVDRFGNFVSATPSGGWLQSSPAIPGLGFCLGTRAQMFWLDERAASALAPGRRPRTTLSPSLAFREGRPYMAFGTPGGDQQDQWTLRAFVYHADFGMPLQAAIDTAAWHSTAFPSSFFPRDAELQGLHAESSLPATTIAELRRRGHRVVECEPWSLGRITAVTRTSDGVVHAAADARSGQAYAVGR